MSDTVINAATLANLMNAIQLAILCAILKWVRGTKEEVTEVRRTLPAEPWTTGGQWPPAAPPGVERADYGPPQ